MAFVRSWTLRLAVVLVILSWTPLSAAFKFDTGDPDVGNSYPNVGAAIFRYQPPPPFDSQVSYFLQCSGTLVGDPARVFISAAHCFDTLAPLFQSPATRPQNLFVTFAPKQGFLVPLANDFVENSPRAQVIDIIVNPVWHASRGLADDGDVAALLLSIDPGSAQPPVGTLPAPAELPKAHLLDALRDANGLQDQRFTAVGYGATDVFFANDFDPNRFFNGQPKFRNPSGYRHIATEGFLALPQGRGYITLSMNIARGNGGGCYGDSGGPNFLGNTRVIAAITSTGDAMCRSTSVAYRLDDDAAQNFFRLVEQVWGVRLLPGE